MSQAEALLNSLTETVIDHTHVVPDSDAHFTIDPYTREIINVNYNKTVLMRGDHNSERFTFELPRYVDGHDMSLCNRVIVHFDNVGDSIENIYSDVAYMDDLQINPNKPETVISSWLIRREATQIVGILSFSLQYQCVEEGEITYEWNTDSYDEIEIRKSKQNGEAAIIKYTNVLEQWRSQIFGAGDSVITNITTEGANQVAAVQTESATQQAAIELKGSETLASIPEDYTEVYNMAEEALRTKADGVVCEAEGETITLADASDDYIRGLNLYGKSTQFSTTGKNKLNLGTQSERTVNGVTLTPVYDSNGNLSYLNVNGTSTSTFILLSVPFHIAAGSYTFTNFPNRTVEDGTLHAQICDSNSGLMYPQDMGFGGDFTFEENVDLIYRIYIAEGRVVNNEKLYPMLRDVSVEDTTYEPYTGGIASPNPQYPQGIESIENPTVIIGAANVFDLDSMLGQYTAVDEDSFGAPYYRSAANIPVTPGETYTICAFVKAQTAAVNGLALSVQNGYEIGYTAVAAPEHIALVAGITTDWSKVVLTFTAVSNWISISSIGTIRKDLMMTIGSVAMEFEPYEAQTITLNRTLPGIPVYSGGNYTDSDGQQWVCDELDLERGVYIQRIGMRVFDETGNYHINSYRFDNGGYYVFGCSSEYVSISDMPVMSDKLVYKQWSKWEMETDANLVCYTGYSFYFYLADQTIQTADAFKSYVTENPITVNYILATPIETPLTAEEIENYKSIKTNYPNTTVLNDSGAWMKVKYNADTKLYVNNTVETGVVKVVEGVLNDTY